MAKSNRPHNRETSNDDCGEHASRAPVQKRPAFAIGLYNTTSIAGPAECFAVLRVMTWESNEKMISSNKTIPNQSFSTRRRRVHRLDLAPQIATFMLCNSTPRTTKEVLFSEEQCNH